jgi:benzoyl-CoA reductase/2-hydroxyglutaryl-CoA dehydratase subunit BcrC/BadD/HgdB
MIRELEVNGVVYHVLRGCHLYGMEVRRVEEVLRRIHVPMLKIETDLKDLEQLRTRLEAFVEVLTSSR